jgi:hypothetical protein
LLVLEGFQASTEQFLLNSEDSQAASKIFVLLVVGYFRPISSFLEIISSVLNIIFWCFGYFIFVEIKVYFSKVQGTDLQVIRNSTA